MQKKIISIFLSFLLLSTLFGCGKEKDASTVDANTLVNVPSMEEAVASNAEQGSAIEEMEPVHSTLATEDMFETKVDDKGVIITKYIGTEKSISIPAEFTTAKYNDEDSGIEIKSSGAIYRIEAEAFKDTAIVRVILPDTITEIGDSAFEGCSNLVEVATGNGITSIGTGAFKNCSSLEYFALSSSLTIICDSAFENCSCMVLYGCSYELKNIGERAFFNTGIVDLWLPATIESIGIEAFAACENLRYAVIERNNEGAETTLGDRVFADNANLTSLDIPANVSTVPASIFDGQGENISVITDENSAASKAADKAGINIVYAATDVDTEDSE